MRPVNLIPPEERRGDGAPTRAGAASYIVVAVLAAILFAVTGVVLANNSVNDKKSELASAQAEQAQTEAKAEALQNFASFQEMKDARVATVTSLAQSRFDWERVVREVSRVLPDHVWLTNLTGTVTPDTTVPKSAEVQARASVPGPALTLVGCARSQEDVAALIAAMQDVDGVTRVLAERSDKPTSHVTASGDKITQDCRTRNYVTQFGLVAAFDAVAPPADATGSSTAAPATPTSSTSSGTITTDTTTPTTASEASDQQQASAPEEQQQAANIKSGTDRARKAAGLVGAGGN